MYRGDLSIRKCHFLKAQGILRPIFLRVKSGISACFVLARERRNFWVCLRDGYSVLQAHSTEGVASHFLKVKKKVQVHLAAQNGNG